MTGRLVLEDGAVFYGKSFGAQKEVMGEIVFNTAMGAYQDILTNPSYYGQIVNFTNPHLGNCGINQNQMVSHPVKLTALLAREYLENFSHPEGTCSLQDFLIQEQIPALFDLDTRKLARKIRNHKTLKEFFLLTLP